MQKVFRHTVLAERQAARRAARRGAKNTFVARKNERDQKIFADRERSGLLKDEARNRREDWELGPLAPARDVGDWKDKYGTINPQLLRGPELPGKDRWHKLEDLGGKHLNIVVGDRVVLLEGKDKGKIGVLKETNARRLECKVEGMNMVDVAVPKWMIGADEPDQRPFRTMEGPIPLPSVRLVYPLVDEETGITKDVIIKRLARTRAQRDALGRSRWIRFIPGLKITIPWPESPGARPAYEPAPVDTLRIDVEAKTYVPTLLIPPMPLTVIDELRNKFSVFRTRHEPEYIAKKEAEENEKVEKQKMMKLMRTPLKEINRKERKLRKARGKGKLTSEMLEKVGKLIAQKRQLVLGEEGASKDIASTKPVVAAA